LCRAHTQAASAQVETGIKRQLQVSSSLCPHTICVLILLYMRPPTVHVTVVYESNAKIWSHVCPHTPVCVSSYCCICVLILLYMCPHTAVCVSSYCYMCVLIQLCILLYICPHTAINVSSYCYMSIVLKLLDMCPSAIYLSSYYYISVFTLLHLHPQG
jgi:hypothetical protein